jgi:hypothetical protein
MGISYGMKGVKQGINTKILRNLLTKLNLEKRWRDDVNYVI